MGGCEYIGPCRHIGPLDVVSQFFTLQEALDLHVDQRVTGRSTRRPLVLLGDQSHLRVQPAQLCAKHLGCGAASAPAINGINLRLALGLELWSALCFVVFFRQSLSE